MFLNNIAPYEKYKKISSTTFFIDKTALLGELIQEFSEEQPYICITRPRRFGKTVMANMIASFFGKAQDGREVFDGLAIAENPEYQHHLNQHDVIYIDFSRVPRGCDSYQGYIGRIEEGLAADLAAAFPGMVPDENAAVWDILAQLFEGEERRKFIFVMDEWDAVFHMSFIREQDKEAYLLFLKNLLKDQEYVELAYMTGILPIAKYSDGSELNMFKEYDMATKIKFSRYFGFLDKEVDLLYERYVAAGGEVRISREDLREWYDGYYTAGGERIYNPRSVVCALADNQLANYWTGSGTYDSIFYYIKNNIAEVQDDLALMVSGEGVETRIQEYSATAKYFDTKAQIYSAMVIYGLLTYEDGKVFIPNKELRKRFEELLY